MAIHVIMGHSQTMTNFMCNCLYVWIQLNSNNIKYTTTLEYFKDYFIGYLGSNSQGTQVKKDQYIIVNQNCDLINDYSKGQIISKCPFGVFVSTKKPTERFRPQPLKRGQIKKIINEIIFK